MLRRTKFNVPIKICRKTSSNGRKLGTSRKYENFKYIIRSDSRNDINEYTKRKTMS